VVNVHTRPATLDGAVMGYARIGRHMAIAANDHVLHLEALAVSPAARGQGVGSLLIDVTIAEAGRGTAQR
jgi:ribosomal protein S18 acetylase RimI-like enzyme